MSGAILSRMLSWRVQRHVTCSPGLLSVFLFSSYVDVDFGMRVSLSFLRSDTWT
jgi:hypothetical protein